MGADRRQSWALKEGDRIQCGDTVYIITSDPIGYGGSAVVYAARRTDTHLRYAIKECFPAGGDYRRQDGVIVPLDRSDSLSGRLLERFRRGAEMEQRTGQIIHNTSDRAVCIRELLHPQSITFQSETYHVADGSVFAVLDRMDLKSKSFDAILEEIRDTCSPEELRLTRGLPGIHTTACLMEEILTALEQVHSARDPERPQVSGYYFGDLHGGNIRFTGSRIHDGIVGTAHLIDFGSARELDADGFTEPLLDENVFAAMGIRPPEMLSGSIFRLSRQSDLFSAGCLMLRCVATQQKLLPYQALPCVGPDFLDAADGRYIGCGPELLAIVNEILDRATARDFTRRYSSAAEMLQQIRRLKTASAPLKNRLNLSLSTLADGEFLGRESDRRKLDRFLENRINPIILWGFPGLGKTELAIDYARRKSRSAGVYFVRFRHSFRATVTGPIADAFSGYSRNLPNGRPKPEDRVYREVLQLLGQCSADDILIIDHADSPGGSFSDLCTEEYRDLCRLPMHLLLTTRSDPEGGGQWHEVGPLDRRSLHKMMLRHAALLPDQMDSMIDAVNAHTLTLDLMARTIARSHYAITPETLLQKLHSGAAAELPQVSTTHDRSSRRIRLQEHLQTLFDLSSIDQEQRTVLCCATLMPPEGMDAVLFRACLPVPDAMTCLTSAGWLTVTDGNRLSIHPVVREVCRASLVPDREQCRSFLHHLRSQCTAPEHALQAASCFAAARHLPGPPDPADAIQAAALYRLAGQYGPAMEHARRALDLSRISFPANHPELAVAWSNLGALYGDMGDYALELEYQLEALRIRQTALPPDHPDLAASYTALGTACGDQGDLKKELQYQQQALHIREACLLPDHPDLADSYARVGDVLCRLGDHRSGVTQQLRALRIRQSILPSNHPDLASSHNNLGKSLCELGKTQEALSHFLDALRIRQTCFSPMHPVIAQSHNNLAVAYALLGNPRRELEHRLSCLKIRRAFLQPDDPKLTDACRNVAKVYAKLKDPEHELEYFLQLLELQTTFLPENDPKLAPTYRHIAMICGELGMQPQRQEYLLKAARAGHLGSMNDLALMFLRSGNDPQALQWLQEAYTRGDGSAANTLGVLYLEGRGVPKDPQKGHSLLLTAACRGSRAAHRHLGRLYLGCWAGAEHFPRDSRQALLHLTQAQKMGATGDEALIRQARTMLAEAERSAHTLSLPEFPFRDDLL